MAMSVGTSSGAVMCDINTTPLIDVMLVLLVTLIVSLPIMTHAVKLDMPQSNNPPPPDQRPDVIDLEIDFDGTVVWNGTPIQSLDQLEGYFHTEADKPVQAEIHLRPDRRVKYDSVARVLAAAQRNRMKKIGFVNTSEFKDCSPPMRYNGMITHSISLACVLASLVLGVAVAGVASLVPTTNPTNATNKDKD